MSDKKSKIWVILFASVTVVFLAAIAFLSANVDPFFHYRKPKTDKYFYTLDNERSQNNGIIRHFDYDALITGTSMAENFKTSELDELFGTHGIKVPFSGASYKEINDNIALALKVNSNVKMVVRGLDMNMFTEDKDRMRLDLGIYPTYLYDDNKMNDIKYLLNRDVFFGRVYPMLNAAAAPCFEPGITSFDDYANWMDKYTFGYDSVCPEGIAAPDTSKEVHLSQKKKEKVIASARQNITSLAAEYPKVDFYYFITPYSAAWWRDLVDNGTVYEQIEAERALIEEILKCKNIKLFSFNNMTDITTNLDNYMEPKHYGEWINSRILEYMKEDKCRLTYDNYESYLAEELKLYTTLDYTALKK